MKRTLACLLLAACEHGQTPIETAIVSPLRTPCQTFAPAMCLTMMQTGKPSELMFFGIEGFTHKWGIETEVELRRERVEPPVADGPSERVILLDVIAELPTVMAPFDLEFPFGGWFSGTASPMNMLGTSVLCEEPVCGQIVSAASGGSAYRVTMELTDDDQTLHALAVQ